METVLLSLGTLLPHTFVKTKTTKNYVQQHWTLRQRAQTSTISANVLLKSPPPPPTTNESLASVSNWKVIEVTLLLVISIRL